ncbi:hypothetical protein ACEPAF_2266 [Sanghuangporus sanghuang]
MSSDSPQQTTRFGKWPDVAKWPEGAEVKTFKGACHCGKFTYELNHPSLDVQKPVCCNCTFCTKSGTLNVFAPEKMLRLDETSASRDELSTFKAKLTGSTHHFCPGCGCYLFWRAMGMIPMALQIRRTLASVYKYVSSGSFIPGSLFDPRNQLETFYSPSRFTGYQAIMSSATPVFVPPPFRKWPDDAEVKTFRGSCHCGRVTFEFDHPQLEVQIPLSCNCSYCSRTGALYIYGPEGTLRITGDEPAGFISKTTKVHHRFCPSCGITVFWTGMRRAGANVRTLEDVDIEKLKVEKFDGARLL